MDLAQITVGTRVRIVEAIEIYPIAIFPVGLVGTVTTIDPESRDVVVNVRLDQYYSGLNEWSNELQVWRDGTDESCCTLDKFEALPTLAHEFPDFDAATLPEIPAGFIDSHWRNETCPHWTRGNLELFIDYADPNKREVPDALRYLLFWQAVPDDAASERETLAYSDDWSDVLDAIGTRFAGTIRDLMTDNGWSEYWTGGGCRAWHKPESAAVYRLICTDDNALYGDPEAREWMLGAYLESGDGWTCVDKLTLAECVQHADTVAPVADEITRSGLAGIAESICAKWVARIGGGFHPDTRGASYVHLGTGGGRLFTDAEAAEYDRDIETLFGLPGDPYEHAIKAIESLG